MNDTSKYQVKCKLRKGDEVIVITGSSKGQSGKIDKVDRKKSRVYVSGVNLGKRHVKPTATNPEGGIIEKAMPLHVSNVSLIDPKTKKPTRVGYKVEDGKKVRFAKASGTLLA